MALGLDVNGLPSTNTWGRPVTGAPGAPGACGTETTTSWRTIGSRVGGAKGRRGRVHAAALAFTVPCAAPFHERGHTSACLSNAPRPVSLAGPRTDPDLS